MHDKPDFHVGDLVRVKNAYSTPALIGEVRKVARVTEMRVYLENHSHGWNTTNPNIVDHLEIVEHAPMPMDDTRQYLETITNIGENHD